MKKILFIFFLIYTKVAFGAAFFSSVDSALATDEWYLLMHYRDTMTGYEGVIDNEEFYFSKEGKTNPRQELIFAINAFKEIEKKYSPAKLSAQCAFPVRFNFVKKNIKEVEFPKVECPEYTSWKNSVIGESVSLVFSTAYVDNPSSMFGHTFIKFNKFPSHIHHMNMLNYIAAFSAKVDTSDPGFLYAIKGLFGGYKGHVSLSPFYMKIREYSHTESRDLWDYELEMSRDQQERLVAHLWELYANANFDYHFMDENCTTMIARSFAVAYNDRRIIGDEDPLYVLPTGYVKTLKKYKKLKTPTLMSSNRRKLMSKLSSLNPSEVEVFDEVAFKSSSAQKGNFKTLDALVHYFDYQRHESEGKVSWNFKKNEHMVLKKMAQTKAQTIDYELIEAINRPDIGHDEHYIGLFTRNKDSLGMKIKFGFHDLLDRDLGHEIYSQINLLDLEVERDFKKNTFNINNFDIVDIKSLPDYTKYDKKTSWSIYAGISPLKERDNYKFDLSIGGGLTTRYDNERGVLTALISAFGSYSDKRQGKFRFGPELSFFSYYQVLENIKLGPRVDFRMPLNDRARYFVNYSFDISYALNRESIFSVKFASRSSEGTLSKLDSNLTLGYGYYF